LILRFQPYIFSAFKFFFTTKARSLQGDIKENFLIFLCVFVTLWFNTFLCGSEKTGQQSNIFPLVCQVKKMYFSDVPYSSRKI